MQVKHKLVTTLLTLALSCLNVQAYVGKEFTTQRSLFLQVESDLKKGKLISYQKHKQSLLGYPLYPYIKYELLKSGIHSIKHADVSAFIKTYHDSPLANKLRNDWLRAKASKNLWVDYLNAYDVNANNDVELQCHYYNAVLHTSKEKWVFEHLSPIWLQGKALPKACDPVFQAWKAEGKLTKSLIWQRIKLCIMNNDVRLARHLAKDLPHEDAKLVELWIRTHHDPHLIHKPHYFTIEHAAVTEMIIHAIVKIAKTNPEDAVRLWQEWERRHAFNEHHWGILVKEIGLVLARKYDPNAEKWLETIPKHLVTKEVTDLQLKLAVSKNSWGSITKTYLNLPEEESRTDKWLYWYARALEMLGNREASQEILAGLSKSRNYYGFLASTRSLKPYSFNHETSDIPPEIVNKVLLKPAVIRAHELKQIGRAHVGKTEWVKAIETLSDQERLAAAQLAQEWEMPNWSIVALSNASNKNDLVLRFPKNFSEYIHKEARNNDIDPEVLFAITRQESAFIPHAKSPAGALGLMQLMPQTGKMVARVSREPLRHHSELLKPDKNIRLGSMYLRMMLDQNQQNHALAAASYNAGPHRVANWIPEYDMPVDSWIELIPFKETREYVQNFLTYTVIYQRLLNKTPKMSKYMPIINGQKRIARRVPIKALTKKKVLAKNTSSKKKLTKQAKRKAKSKKSVKVAKNKKTTNRKSHAS
ncbi:MAG TPA: transglycosylase SLT domain-containing protein [Gammaproteobacteria bacterium]|nr:transglycosylase SLT domain-containing protein [Gammaproteobacteria bacterium]